MDVNEIQKIRNRENEPEAQEINRQIRNLIESTKSVELFENRTARRKKAKALRKARQT